MPCRRARYFPNDPRLATTECNQIRDSIGEFTLASHACIEARIVESTSPDGSNAVEDFILPIREMVDQPLLEQRCDGPRKPQGCVTREGGSGIRDGL